MPKIEDAEDRAVFLDPEEHGEEVTWTPGGAPGAPRVLVGIGEREFQDYDIAVESGVAIESSNPRFTCDSYAAQGVADGDTLTFGQDSDFASDGKRTWFVRGIEPDGTGMTALKLAEV